MRSKVSWVYRVCCGLSFWPLAHRQAVPEAVCHFVKEDALLKELFYQPVVQHVAGQMPDDTGSAYLPAYGVQVHLLVNVGKVAV